MPIASTPPGHACPVGRLGTKGHYVPWILLVVVIGIGVAGSQRGAANAQADPPASQAGPPESSAVAVHCDLRRGFVLRVAMYAQLLVHSVVPGSAHAQRTHGATCHVQP